MKVLSKFRRKSRGHNGPLDFSTVISDELTKDICDGIKIDPWAYDPPSTFKNPYSLKPGESMHYQSDHSIDAMRYYQEQHNLNHKDILRWREAASGARMEPPIDVIEKRLVDQDAVVYYLSLPAQEIRVKVSLRTLGHSKTEQKETARHLLKSQVGKQINETLNNRDMNFHTDESHWSDQASYRSSADQIATESVRESHLKTLDRAVNSIRNKAVR